MANISWPRFLRMKFWRTLLLDSESRSASVTTLSDCIFLKIEQEAFYDVVAVNTDILKGIMRTICRRLRSKTGSRLK